MEYLEPKIIKILLQKFGTGFSNHDDPIFTEGNYLIEKFQRLGVFTSYENSESENNGNESTCFLCHEKFSTINGYETHYNSHHRYICQFCKKNSPSAHLLDLHLEEVHDSFFAVRSEKKEMYSCYLQECNHKSWNPQDRKDHCIKTHNFPHNFRFAKQSKAKHVQQSKSNKVQETSENSMDVSDVSTNNVVPKTIRNFNFGHQKVKTFAMETIPNKQNKGDSKILEDNRMVQDLMDNLPLN